MDLGILQQKDGNKQDSYLVIVGGRAVAVGVASQEAQGFFAFEELDHCPPQPPRILDRAPRVDGEVLIE